MTSRYNGLPSTGEKPSESTIGPIRMPPPKPPKLPQDYEDDSLRHAKSASRKASHSSKPNLHYPEPVLNQAQGQHQDFLEQPHRKSSPAAVQTTESATSYNRQHGNISHDEEQSHQRSNNSSATHSGLLNHRAQQEQETTKPSTIGNTSHRISEDNDDLHWMLPLINENSASAKMSSKEPEIFVPCQPQQQAFDASHQSPNAVKPKQYPSSSSSSRQSSNQLVHGIEKPSMQHQNLQPSGDANDEHQHTDTFHLVSGHSNIDSQRIDDPPPAQLMGLSTINGHQDLQKLASANTLHKEATTKEDASIYASPGKPYNASALGFGGPSDWEHFGDYQAMEVDDTDLYGGNKAYPVSKEESDSAELPGEKSPIDDLKHLDRSHIINVKAAPSSGNIYPIPARLRPAIRSQSTPPPTEAPNAEPVKPIPSPPYEQPFIVRQKRTDSLSNSYEGVRLPTLEIEVDERIRLGTETPSSNKVCENQSPNAKSRSPEIPNSKRSECDKLQETASNPDPIFVPARLSTGSDHSTHQRHPTEAQPEINPIARFEDTGTTSGLRNSTVSSQTNNSEPEVRATGIDEPRPILGSIQEQESIERMQDITADITMGSSYSTNETIVKETAKDHPTSSNASSPTKIVQNVQFLSSLNGSINQRLSKSEQSVSNLDSSPISARFPLISDENALQLQRTDENLDLAISSDQGNLIANRSLLDTPSESHKTSISLVSEDDIDQTGPIEQKSTSTYHHGALETIGPEAHMNATDLERLETTNLSSPVTIVDNMSSHEYSQNSLNVPPDPQANSATLVTNLEADSPNTSLDPWGKASLNRYVAMLNEEAQAKTDKEKFNIFMVFANRESRLRAVLYGTDDATTSIEQTPNRNAPKHLATTLTKRSHKALPALPALPRQGELQVQQMANESSGASSTTQDLQDVSNLGSTTLREETRADQLSRLSTTSKGGSPIDDMEYSPGGRPIVTRANVTEDGLKKPSSELSLREKVSKVFTQVASFTSSIPSTGTDGPIVANPDVLGSYQKPAYMPFKNEGRVESNQTGRNRQSAYRPYAALKFSTPDNKTDASTEYEGKKEKASETHIIATSDMKSQNDYARGVNDRVLDVVPAEEKRQTDASLDLRRFVRADFDPLVSVLPSSTTIHPEPIQLQDMQKAMDAIPDDFSFIHHSVLVWDAEAKKKRENHEKERHIRQGESERKIDALFDDHEIGYGDIPELESEFKKSEAARKTDEDRAEYQTFLASVFDVVWTRLHYEIAQLPPLYEEYTQKLKDALVGKDMFEGSAKDSALAPMMSLLLALHQKIEIRHQKAFEAVLERDRRLKKTEVSPWYTLGNVAKVKQLEKQFESAEKKTIVEYCKQRSIRANQLMDILDQNTLRGVGANQDYMEAIMKSIRRIASGRAFASMPSSESGLGVDEVMKAKSVTATLASSSEQLVQTFHVADMLLNAADYEVSVANARLANSDAKTFTRLEEERSKEDQKLMGNLEHRLALIRKDTRRTQDEIVKLLLFLGVQNGHAEGSQMSSPPPSSNPENGDRAEKAIENAKRRNARKQSVG